MTSRRLGWTTGAVHPSPTLFILPAEMDWQRDALCKKTGPALFFPEQGESSAQDAKRVCAGCPVREKCLEYALANREPAGVWGGLDETERRRLLERARLTGRPVRDVVPVCRKGLHDMVASNVVVRRDGGRRCAACIRVTDAAAAQRRRELRQARRLAAATTERKAA